MHRRRIPFDARRTVSSATQRGTPVCPVLCKVLAELRPVAVPLARPQPLRDLRPAVGARRVLSDKLVDHGPDDAALAVGEVWIGETRHAGRVPRQFPQRNGNPACVVGQGRVYVHA